MGERLKSLQHVEEREEDGGGLVGRLWRLDVGKRGEGSAEGERRVHGEI